MDNFFTNMKTLLGYNHKLFMLAYDKYLEDAEANPEDNEALYQLILDRLVAPVRQKDADRELRFSKRDVNSKFWMRTPHPIAKFNAQVQSHQNKGVYLELQSLHNSKKYMSDFLSANELRVETNPFGEMELAANDNIDEREVLYSPIMMLTSEGKKAIAQRFDKDDQSTEPGE